MFKELGSMMSLLGNKGKIQEEIGKFQQQVGYITAEATAGAGYVTVKVNGRMEVLAVRISEEAMDLNDREMLEDLVAAAANQAAGQGPRAAGRGDGQDGRRHRPARRACSAAAFRVGG